MKQGFESIREMLVNIENNAAMKKDYYVNSRSLHFDTLDGYNRLTMESPDGNYQFGINDIALAQMAKYHEIPMKYVNLMQQENPALLANNMNAWFQSRKPERRFIRTLEGTNRAFLSNRYGVIDNDMVAATVFPVLEGIPDLDIVSCEITDRKLYLKVVNKRIQEDVVPGDTVQSGVVISNSEVGHGAFSVQPLVYRLVCSNGMVVNDAAARKNHVSRSAAESSMFELFKPDTIEADNQVLMKKMRDLVESVSDRKVFNRVVDMYRDAKDTRFESNDIPAIVEATGTVFKLTEEERKNVLQHFIRRDDLSLYGLSNAVTEASQQVESYDRASELEKTGYSILTMPRRSWHELNAA